MKSTKSSVKPPRSPCMLPPSSSLLRPQFEEIFYKLPVERAKKLKTPHSFTIKGILLWWSTETVFYRNTDTKIRPLQKTEILAKTPTFGRNTLFLQKQICFGSSVQLRINSQNSLFRPKFPNFERKMCFGRNTEGGESRNIKTEPKLVSVDHQRRLLLIIENLVNA